MIIFFILGQISEESCPGNLLFDPATISCQYANACGKPIPIYETPKKQDTVEYQQSVCTGRKNGYYINIPCTTTFFTCHEGQSFKISCPPLLVIDPVSKQCKYPHECIVQEKQVLFLIIIKKFETYLVCNAKLHSILKLQ